MKLKLFLLALCLTAFIAAMSAQTKQPMTIMVKGSTYTTAKPEATVESLTKNCIDTGETLEVDGFKTSVWQSKATKKYPEGRIFIIKRSKTGKLSRFYLNKI